MAILLECPACKRRNARAAKVCRNPDCRHGMTNIKIRIYWLDYYANGKRRRERIGASLRAAEARWLEILKSKAEGGLIPTKWMLRDLLNWYLELAEVKALKSVSDVAAALALVADGMPAIRADAVNLGHVDAYVRARQSSTTRFGKAPRPASINRELANLRAAYNAALRHGRISRNPLAGIRLLAENNVRTVRLTSEQFISLHSFCPAWLQPIVLTAYLLPMRKAEILQLQWQELDLKGGTITLAGGRTKSGFGRVVPLHPRLVEVYSRLPRSISGGPVFLRDGGPVKAIEGAWRKARTEAGLEGLHFHDLRHLAINNLRMAGNDPLVIRAASGHRTAASFERYTDVATPEVLGIVWKEE